MVISFKLSRRGRRFYPPPPPASDPPPPAASPDESPLPPQPPPPPRNADEARLGSGLSARSGVLGRSGSDPVGSDLEPSFALNLFPDGYSIGEPGKGMLVLLIGDDPEKQPYNRASKALLADIEYGFLPQDILHGIPCKFQNGTIVCEVRDYRSFLSNGGDSSGYDFPKMNRVILRLGFECVVKDLPSIADASWTYHDHLIAESTIINTLQPRINLDPTPCLETLCNSVVKKIDLGIKKGRHHAVVKDLPSIADTSLLNISANSPARCKLKDACEGKAVCIDNAALEVLAGGVLNNSSVNCPSSLQINNAKSAVESDPNNTIKHSSALKNCSALGDSQQNGSHTPASDHLLQSYEQRAQVAVIQVDPKNGQSRRETVAHCAVKDLPSIGDTSLLNISADPPEKCRLKECDTCEGKALCIDNAALEVSPHGVFNNSSVNCPSSLQINNAKSTVGSDPDNTIQNSSILRNSSALCDSQHNASSTPASDHLLQSHEQRAQVAFTQVDPKNGQSRKETVAQKRKESSDLPREMHERQNGRSSNKHARFSSQSSKGQFQKSIGTSNKQRLELGSRKGPRVDVKVDPTVCNKDMGVQQQKPLTILPINCPLSSRNTPYLEKISKKIKLGSAKEHLVEFKVDQTVGSKDMRVHQQKPLSLLPTSRPLPSLERNTPCLEKIPEKVKVSSPKELPVEVKVDHTINKKDTRGQQYQPLSMIPTNNPHPSLNRNNPFVERISENVSSSHIRIKGSHLAPIIDLDNYGIADRKDSRIPPVTSCNVSSRKPTGKLHEDKAVTGTQPITSKRKVSVTSTDSLNQKIDLKGKRQKKANIHIKPPCDNRSSVEPGVTDDTSSQSGISPDIELCIGDPVYTPESDIEKVLSEVILTTQRHGLNLKAAKTDGLETSMPLSSSCSSSKFFQYESSEGSLHKREEINTCYPTGRTKNNRNIRRFVFHRVQYFCRGIIDQSHCILCLLESEVLDDHQVAVGTIFGDEHIHIATLPTSDHADKFVDQFILLMKRDGYTLCNATVCNGFSEQRQSEAFLAHRLLDTLNGMNHLFQQAKDVSQLNYLAGEYPQYQGFSPCVPKSIVINESKDTRFPFQKRLPDVHANVLQQWGLPHLHVNALQQGNQQLGLPDVHRNVMHQGSQQLGLSDVHGNVMQQGYQQWGRPDVHANVLQQGSQQWMPTEQSPTLGVGTFNFVNPKHLVERPDVHGNVMHQGRQQLGLPDVHGNVMQQGYQQWGRPDVHANVLQQGSQQWMPTEQSSTSGVGTFDFANPKHLVEQQYNSRVLQDQGLPFASGVCSMDLDQYLCADTSPEVNMDQYSQYRHDMPRFSGRSATNMNTSSLIQQYQILPPQLEGRMHQRDFQDFGRQFNTCPPLHAGKSMLLSTSHPVGSLQISSQTTGSNDSTVTSTPAHLLAPPSYQYLSQGICR